MHHDNARTLNLRGKNRDQCAYSNSCINKVRTKRVYRMISVPVDARSESIGASFVYAFRSYLRIPSLMLEMVAHSYTLRALNSASRPIQTKDGA